MYLTTHCCQTALPVNRSSQNLISKFTECTLSDKENLRFRYLLITKWGQCPIFSDQRNQFQRYVGTIAIYAY